MFKIACLLTLAYSIAHRYTRFNAHKAPLILALLIFTSICMLLLAFYWEQTIWIGNNQYSFALIGLTFLMASVKILIQFLLNFNELRFVPPPMSSFFPTWPHSIQLIWLHFLLGWVLVRWCPVCSKLFKVLFKHFSKSNFYKIKFEKQPINFKSKFSILPIKLIFVL